MTRLKDQIRIAKMALKQAKTKPWLYTEEELLYMRKQLAIAKRNLEEKRQRRRKQRGFDYETGKTDLGDSRSGEDDGLCGEGEQPSEPGQS